MTALYLILGGAMLTGILALFEFVSGTLSVPAASLPALAVLQPSAGAPPVDLRLIDRRFLAVLAGYQPSWKGRLCTELLKGLVDSNDPMVTGYLATYRTSLAAGAIEISEPKLFNYATGCAINNYSHKHRVILTESATPGGMPGYFSCSLASQVGAERCTYERPL